MPWCYSMDHRCKSTIWNRDGCDASGITSGSGIRIPGKALAKSRVSPGVCPRFEGCCGCAAGESGTAGNEGMLGNGNGAPSVFEFWNVCCLVWASAKSLMSRNWRSLPEGGARSLKRFQIGDTLLKNSPSENKCRGRVERLSSSVFYIEYHWQNVRNFWSYFRPKCYRKKFKFRSYFRKKCKFRSYFQKKRKFRTFCLW